MKAGPVSEFIDRHYRHFNAAAVKDAADAYIAHINGGGKMMITLAGAMSTAELGISLAEMIRQDKVHAITCTGANLEEDLFNLVARTHYERLPNYRELSPKQEEALLKRHLNRVTDTCIPEEEAIRRIERLLIDEWVLAVKTKERKFPHEFLCKVLRECRLNQDLITDQVPEWGYFCQISDSTTSFGSYSGAVPNEKITWGKLRASTPRFIIESDATIVAPLIFAKVLGW